MGMFRNQRVKLPMDGLSHNTPLYVVLSTCLTMAVPHETTIQRCFTICNGKGVFRIRTQSYRGKGKVIGHVAGRLIFLVYALLKQDEEVLSHLAPGAEPPAPTLYDPELHRQHRTGHYQPLKRRAVGNRSVQISS
jgi:hypothetical protein